MEIFGIVLFALGILVSVSLHEAGHMLTAKSFGMKVTRYFVGFGPTLWSFKRGETEYGVKGIPLGGFCKIVGMTPQDDDVAPEDEPRAMWRYPVWKRTIVMGAGSVDPLRARDRRPLPGRDLHGPAQPGVPADDAEARQQPAVVVARRLRRPVNRQSGACAARRPGQPGRRPPACRPATRSSRSTAPPVTDLGRHDQGVRAIPPGPAQVTYERDGQTGTTHGQPRRASQRPTARRPGPARTTTVSAMGVGLQISVPAMVTYSPVDAFGATADFTGDMVGADAARDQAGPGEGAGAVDGDHRRRARRRHADQRGRRQPARRRGCRERGCWELFVLLFISLNFFVGVFNLLPLLPLDGGHIAIAWFETASARGSTRGCGRADPGRVDYYKLMPLTYAVILIVGAFTLLTITADIVNPITIFSR